jgi:hypothetical protein
MGLGDDVESTKTPNKPALDFWDAYFQKQGK